MLQVLIYVLIRVPVEGPKSPVEGTKSPLEGPQSPLESPNVRCLPYGMTVEGSVSSHLSCILCSSYLEVNNMPNWCSILMVGLIDQCVRECSIHCHAISCIYDDDDEWVIYSNQTILRRVHHS